MGSLCTSLASSSANPPQISKKNWYVYGLKCTVNFLGKSPDQSSAPRFAPSYNLGSAPSSTRCRLVFVCCYTSRADWRRLCSVAAVSGESWLCVLRVLHVGRRLTHCLMLRSLILRQINLS